MEKLVRPSRMIALILALAILLTVYAAALYELQVVEGAKYAEVSANSIVTTTTLAAARGDILDRNGVLLVSSRPVYRVGLSRSTLLKLPNPNAALLTLINTALENGVHYNDDFPVTMSGPFSYLNAMTQQQQSRLARYLAYFKLDENISASDLIVWLKEHYGLDYTTNLSDARRIIGIRYELELRVIVGMADYVFASDADVDFISIILERDLPFISIDTSYARKYHTTSAAHLLGFTGSIPSEDIQIYKDLGYSLDAVVGRSGAEQAFESYLHGRDGSITTNTNAAGAVISVLSETPAEPGQNLYLTLDIGLQAVAEQALAETIAEINATRGEDEERITGGAAVAIDIATGGVLAAANCPTYDPATYYSNFTALNADPTLPLYNRATQGTYNPGSTFKMVSAYAGLKSKYLDRWFTIADQGKYTRYPDFQPSCWVYPGDHGTINVVEALAVSCNYFFYKVADTIGIDAIASAAAEFGLGSKTGIEIGESAGVIATPAYKKAELNEGWWAADNLMAAIGQSYNKFTPIQLANYVATIADGGVRHKLTLLKQTKSSDYTQRLFENEPVIASIADDPDGYIAILQEGMRAVTSPGGTAYSMFGKYPVKVAAKTGTVQSDTAAMNTGVFVCYAPADRPEIAIAVVVEKGGSGSAITAVGRAMLDHYFATDSQSYTFGAENTLLP